LLITEDPAAKELQLVWKWELRSYFGLSFAQVEEMQTNWNAFYDSEKAVVLLTVPTVEPYISATGIAYWQWADSYETQFHNDPAEASVVFASDLITGYPEFWYWLNYYCNPTRNGAMSSANWEIFKDVTMYRDTSDPTVNMEYLFNLVDVETGGDPTANSLFNLTTL
jgi:hypothetical protein